MGSLWSARWEPFVLDHPPLDLLDGDLAEALVEVVQSQYHQLAVVGGDRVHGGDLGIIILGHKCQVKLSPASVSPARQCPPPPGCCPRPSWGSARRGAICKNVCFNPLRETGVDVRSRVIYGCSENLVRECRVEILMSHDHRLCQIDDSTTHYPRTLSVT